MSWLNDQIHHSGFSYCGQQVQTLQWPNSKLQPKIHNRPDLLLFHNIVKTSAECQKEYEYFFIWPFHSTFLPASKETQFLVTFFFLSLKIKLFHLQSPEKAEELLLCWLFVQCFSVFLWFLTLHCFWVWSVLFMHLFWLSAARFYASGQG